MAADVVIVGGGVVGLSIAYELVRSGQTVTVLDRQDLGTEASWAGAGMLRPGRLAGARSPQARLRAASAALWPTWSEQLGEDAGIDNGYHVCGGIELLDSSQPASARADEISSWANEGVLVENLSPAEAQRIVPQLHPEQQVAYFLPEHAQVRNPRHLRALITALTRRGATLLPATPVIGWTHSAGRVTAVQTPSGEISGGSFALAAGAWTGLVAQSIVPELPVAPVRGQIALLKTAARPFRPILQSGPRYLVPRDDGRVLVGSTQEHVGFATGNTAEGVHGLLQFAFEVFPALREAAVERTWSGLRPHTPSSMPLMGPCPGYENLFVATGHFRNGLELSPITAALIAELILRKPPQLDVRPYALLTDNRVTPPGAQ